MIVGELAEFDGAVFGVMSPPVDAENPAAERDGGDLEIGISESATNHARILGERFARG